MYGALLPRNAQGGVNAGLGQTISAGVRGLIEPTREIKRTGEEVTIDGVRMVFQMTPGTEALAEMNTYFPQFRAMWMAEKHHQHAATVYFQFISSDFRLVFNLRG